MKTNSILITNFLFVILFFILTGCPQSNSANKKYTVKGILIFSCDNPSPVQNMNMELDYFSNGVLQKVLGNVTTDNNGNFSFTYNGVNDNIILPGISVGYQAGYSNEYIYGGPPNTDIDLGKIYQQDNYFAKITIQTNTPFTNLDTLYYCLHDVNHPKKLIGPFYNEQVLDSTSFSSPISYKAYSNVYLLAWKWGYDFQNEHRYNDTFYQQPMVQCQKYNNFVLKLRR